MRPTLWARSGERTLILLENVLHFVACIALVLLVGIVTWDAASRLVFGRPLQFQFELTELYLMPAVSMLSLSWVYRNRAHLSLDLVDPAGLGRAGPPIQFAIIAISAGFFGLVAWKSGAYAAAIWARGDVYMGYRDWPVWLAYASGPLGCGVITFRLLHELWRALWLLPSKGGN